MDKDDNLRIVSAQVPEADVARLQQEARKADRTLSAQIRRLVREHFEYEQPPERPR